LRFEINVHDTSIPYSQNLQGLKYMRLISFSVFYQICSLLSMCHILKNHMAVHIW